MNLIGRHFLTGGAVEIETTDRIVAVRTVPMTASAAESLPWIAPGLVDLQINGCLGHEFSSPRLAVADVAAVARQAATTGVTRFCATVTTAGCETLRHAVATIASACAADPAVDHAVLGIHLEGPYISAADGPRGAHPRQHCRPPDWDEFERLQRAAAGRIRLVTLSAEYSAAPAFIAKLVAAGVRVALGHMQADAEQIRAAVAAGATLSTHLGNGCHTLLPRHPNYLWDQLAEDRLTATLIVDGHHLPAAVVRAFVRAKTPARTILISDWSGFAGLPPGEYATGLDRIEILADGRFVVAGQRTLLAGASAPLTVGIVNVMRFAGIDLATAWRMATSQALEAMCLPPVALCVGEPADVVLFRLAAADVAADRGLQMDCVLQAGRLVHAAESAGSGLDQD